MFNNYAQIVSEAKYKTKYGEGLKVLTPKQMLHRLPIALTQVKACNTSENLRTKIRKICIEQNELLKKYITIL